MKKLLLLTALFAFAFSAMANKAFKKADTYFSQGKYKEAIAAYAPLVKSFEKSKKATPEEVGYLNNQLGECYLVLRSYARAEEAFAQAESKGYKKGNFQRSYGLAMLRNGNAEKALVQFQAFLADHPDDEEVKSCIRQAEFAIRALENPKSKLNPVRIETALNAHNNQRSLAWYKGALLFSSDRTSEKGSKKPGPTHYYFAKPVYDFTENRVGDWLPIESLKALKTSFPDNAFAYDATHSLYYVMRCVETKKSKNCNIYLYSLDKKGKFTRPAKLSFHNETAAVGHQTLNSDGSVMFFTITKDKKSDIYVSKKSLGTQWSTPLLLSSVINTTGEETSPQLYRDSILFFASDGHPGMGGLDVFYTKITLDGVGHAINKTTDLSKIVFTTPVNLQAPINSGADDYSLLMKGDGEGGFFISNRTHDKRNFNAIYSFPNEPFVFDAVGLYLAQRSFVQSTVFTPGSASMTPKTEDIRTAPFLKVDTIYLERVVEKPVIVEKEVFVDGGTEQAILNQKEAIIATQNEKIRELDAALLACQATLLIDEGGAEASQEVLKTDLVEVKTDLVSPVAMPTATPAKKTAKGVFDDGFRVQLAANLVPSDFSLSFPYLSSQMPSLQMEVIASADGYYRYVTLAYASYAEADAVRMQLKSLGYQCFVAHYREGERVSMSVK